MNIFSLLKKYNVHPKKRLGQHFLTATPTLEKIVRHLDPAPDDKIIEIGPGLGIMTKMLTDEVKFVAAVEADREMINILENELGSIANLHIICGDILDTNLTKLVTGPDRWLFVGNIPYNISSPLLFHLRNHRKGFKYGLLTLQKEVADRLTASPRSKDYGILTVNMQVVARIEKCFSISPSSFFPEPRVDSTVIKLTFYDQPLYNVDDLDFFTRVVRAAFSTRRKKLKNALTQSEFLDIAAQKIEKAIEQTGIKETARAEELDIETFAKLARNLEQEV